MRTLRAIGFLSVILIAGGMATAVLDWRQDQRANATSIQRSAQRLVSLLSMYPLADTDTGMRNLLAKSLVEQLGPELAYLSVMDADRQRVLEIGDQSLRASSGVQADGAVSRAPDGKGAIVEFSRALLYQDQRGTVLLGMRVETLPLFALDRLSSVAAVLFLMLSAMIVGYYAIVLSTRRWAREAAAQSAAPEGRADDNILKAYERMNAVIASAGQKLREAEEQNADLSSRLGVITFEAQQAYRVLDGLDFGMLVLDPQGRIRRVNRRMLDLLGRERATIEGHAFGEVLQHDDLLSLVDAQQEGTSRMDVPTETRFPETAPERDFELSGCSLVDASGEAIGLLVTTQDVTRLKRAHKAQEDFLAKAAHELLSPLTSIKGYAELLASGNADDEQMRKEFYNTINIEADRLTDLIRNLLSTSKFETGQLDMDQSLVRTDWLVEQCLPAVEPSAQGKHIAIEKRLPDVFPTIMGDKELLKVVLINLLSNAVKYTPNGGTIRMAIFQQDHSVFFEVSDTGCGIPADEQPHVFEKFYRGRSASVRDQVGSGMGLATALQVAKLHGGSIDVQSEPGKGSCFTVRIPVEDYNLEKH